MSDGKKDSSNWIRSALAQYQLPLTRYAFRITGDVERARDVVQDTFLQLCRERPSRLRDHLAEWLFTVCRNRALDVRRKESRMTTLSEVQAASRADCTAGPAALVELAEHTRQVLRILGQLPANQQEVVRLKFQNELSYKEISRITGLSVSNVGFLLHTAINKIRQLLEAESRPAPQTIRRIK